MSSYDTPNAAEMYFNQSIFGHLYAAIAGVPAAMSFDAATGAFRLRYRPDRRITAPTEIFVSPLHYPDGYRVTVTGGTAVRVSGRMVHVTPTSADAGGTTRPVVVRIKCPS